MNHYLKTTILIVALGTMTIFSKTIQRELIEGYNKYIAFMGTNSSKTITPLGV